MTTTTRKAAAAAAASASAGGAASSSTTTTTTTTVVVLLLLVMAASYAPVEGFAFLPAVGRAAAVPATSCGAQTTTLFASSGKGVEAAATTTAADASDSDETQTLGLLTFDLDDTLYPIEKVEEAANRAFVKAMSRYGFEGLKPDDIVKAAKGIRDEMNRTDPMRAAALTHREVRELAIRREMEKIVERQRLKDCADDWATPVESLSPLVAANAKKWAKVAVSDSTVKAVSTAWEMERHHAAERCLYPEVLDALAQIKQEHPTAIIGAVTDGRSNPMFMTFTLGRYFDFSCSWEDDQVANRKKFFQELEGTAGDTSQLTWIYDEARYKYAVLKQAADAMAAAKEGKDDVMKKRDKKELVDAESVKKKPSPPGAALVYPATYDDRVWIHVGDDLAFDVGGSAACGARTIYCELDDAKYGQTARYRYYSYGHGDKGGGGEQDADAPANGSARTAPWSTTPSAELKKRYLMAKTAEAKVDVRLKFLTRLPEAIDEVLAMPLKEKEK